MEMTNRIFWLSVVLISFSLFGCVQPNRAKIEFKNQTDQTIKSIVISGRLVEEKLGPIYGRQNLIWTKKLPEGNELRISVEFESGVKLERLEPYFNNQRQIIIKINQDKLDVVVLSEGYL